MEYRDFINTNMNDVITALNGSITPAPVNSELYRDFLNRKADDVITALNESITPAPAGGELYRDFIERKFDDVIAGIGGYLPPLSFPTLTGSIVTFNSQYAGLPLKSHKINIDSVSGVSAINISATGKNLVDFTARTVTSQARIIDNLYLNKGDYRFTISVINNTNINGVFAIRIGTTNIKTVGFNGNFEGIASTTFNLTENSIINIILGGGSAGYSFDISNAQIEIGTASTSYEPYNGSFTTINIGQTVNEGEYDSRTGILEVTMPSVQTLQLIPCPIDTTGVGVQNIWADTGDTTLQYIKIGGNT